jgi:hypothetical protein
MDPKEAEKFLREGDAGSLEPVAVGAPTPSAEPSAAPQGFPSDLGQPSPIESVLQRKEKEYRAAEEQPGIPLDLQTGASPWERFWVGSMRAKEDALAHMQQKYGPKNVRLDRQGDFIFRVPDLETGKPKDIKFHPNDMTVGDFTALASAVPEIVGTLAAIRGGRGIPKVGQLKGLAGVSRDVGAAAVGGEATGALKDVAMHELERGQADIPETLQERGKMALTDVGLGYAGFGAGKFFKFMGAPFAGGRGPIQFDAAAAKKYFAEHPRYGVDVPLTASELTGSPLLGRSEVYTEIQPGGFGPMKALKEKQEQALLQIQKQMMGVAPPPSLEEIGTRMEQALEPQIAPAEAATRQAGKELQEAGTARVGNIVTALTTPERQLYREATGKEVRDKVLALQKAEMEKASALYTQADALGAKDKLVDGTDLQARFRQILKQLPSAEVTKEAPTGILDVFGRPTTQSVTAKQTLENWPPSKLLARLREVTAMKDPKFSISDLKQMRADIYDDLARGQGVPDLGAHYLSQMGNAITASMKEAVDKMPNDALKKALMAADKHWKERVVPFDRPGITELFRREGEGGFIPNDEVISRIFTTSKSPSVSIQNWNLMKETLGAASPEFTKIKRALADHILENSRSAGEEFIDPKHLSQSLANLRTNYRSIADEVFGPRINELFREAKFLEYGANPKISSEDLSALLRDPSPTAAKLQSLITKQAKLDDLYRNEILRSVAKGRLPENAINPREFAARFIDNTKTNPNDIKQVLGMLQQRPALLEDIQAKALETLFRDSAMKISAGNISRVLSGNTSGVASNIGFAKALSQEGAAKKLQLLLGSEKWADLQEYSKLLAGTEYKYAASGYQMAGAFAATHTVKSLEQLKLLQFAKPTVANWFVAKMLTSTPFRQWAGHVPANPDPGFVSLFLTSPIFLREVQKDFPGSAASPFIAAVKEAMDEWVRGEKVRHDTTSDMGDEAQRRQFWEQTLAKERARMQPTTK